MQKSRYFRCLITLPRPNHFCADLLQRGSQCSGGAAFSSCLCLLRAFCLSASFVFFSYLDWEKKKLNISGDALIYSHTHLHTCESQLFRCSSSPWPPALQSVVLSVRSAMRRWAQGCGAQPPPPAILLKDNAVYCICQANAAILCKSIAHLLPCTLS